ATHAHSPVTAEEDDPAEEVRARARHLGQDVADQASRAGFRRRDREPALDRLDLEGTRELDELVERRVGRRLSERSGAPGPAPGARPWAPRPSPWCRGRR